MYVKYIVGFLVLSLFSSCHFFRFDKQQDAYALDTVINFSKVDVSPSFPICDSLIDKTKKDACFRTAIFNAISKKIIEHQFTVQQDIDEMVLVNLSITNSGKVLLKSIESSKIIKKEIPKLDSLLFVSVQELPKLQPALKRGIPVATQYQLPIRIVLKE